jgi:hypothetical protein
LLIAFEWRHVFRREHERRIDELGHDYERSRAEGAGIPYEDPRGSDHTMWREFQKLFLKEWRYRRKIFYAGVVLVVLGFIGQTLGSWPGHRDIAHAACKLWLPGRLARRSSTVRLEQRFR